MQNYYIGCAICGRPIRLEEAHTGDEGLPMHEECFLLKLKLKQMTTPHTKENAA